MKTTGIFCNCVIHLSPYYYVTMIITTRWRNKGGHSPVAGYNDFRLCAKNNTSLTYRPTTVG